ncbi:MAG TPA: hypothetical protein VF173_30180 [Thermoanaerobaculia bacterium]|nr:hypothetical protein [Thermoanaerobaculia bacterium]
MKKVIRLALLLGLAFLASWGSAPKNAYALPLCDGFDGRACTVPGKTIPCLWRQGGGGGCICDRVEHIWEC